MLPAKCNQYVTRARSLHGNRYAASWSMGYLKSLSFVSGTGAHEKGVTYMWSHLMVSRNVRYF